MENKQAEDQAFEEELETHEGCCGGHDHIHEEQKTPSLEEELAYAKDQWLRSVAETENLRRRFQKEKEDALKYASLSFAKDIITITDYLEQALATMQAASDNEALKPFITGVKMTADELQNVFSRHGIKKVASEKQKFDPNLHQAMMEIETDDHDSGSIVQVLQNGYTMHDRLLRPSLVGVAKKKS